jgi:hypothetical protein
MNCENKKSFILYLNRAKERVTDWINVIIELLFIILNKTNDINLENTISRDRYFRENWNYYLKLVKQYFDEYSKLPDSKRINNNFQLIGIHAILTQKRFGLGP